MCSSIRVASNCGVVVIAVDALAELEPDSVVDWREQAQTTTNRSSTVNRPIRNFPCRNVPNSRETSARRLPLPNSQLPKEALSAVALGSWRVGTTN